MPFHRDMPLRRVTAWVITGTSGCRHWSKSPDVMVQRQKKSEWVGLMNSLRKSKRMRNNAAGRGVKGGKEAG